MRAMFVLRQNPIQLGAVVSPQLHGEFRRPVDPKVAPDVEFISGLESEMNLRRAKLVLLYAQFINKTHSMNNKTTITFYINETLFL